MEAPQQPPPPKRLPSLKITSNPSGPATTAPAASSLITPNSSFQQSMSPGPATPSQAPTKIIKLVSKSQPSTPADSHPPSYVIARAGTSATGAAALKPTQTKGGRVSKPSAKKRTRNESDDDDEDAHLANGATVEHRAKKTKITLKPVTPGLTRQPTLKVKPVGRIPQKPLGEGYDSEAEDRDVDPVIEEQVLFRMMPGEHCDYLRSALQAKQIGLPKSQGGADFSIKWLDDESRRAVVVVKGQLYAAILLDLPTITEGMKTWDKKAMVKSSDICQMLMVFAQVRSEEEVRTVPLPKAVEHGHRWPHGITPPMHDARNRRFRKRLSKLEIKNKEAEVDRLLSSDREALSVRTEWIDSKQNGTADEDEDEEDEEEYEEDAEGEADDYFGDADAEQAEEDGLFDDAALEAEFLEAVETPAMDLATPGGVLAATPGAASGATPAAQADEEAGGADEEESDEDEDEDADEDEEDEDEGDDEEVAGIRNEITNLKKQLKMYEDQLAASVLPIMRKRLEVNIRNVKSEILLKKSAIGETEED